MSPLHPMHSPLSLPTPMCLLHISIPHSHVSVTPHAFPSLPAHSHVSPTYFYTSFPCLRYTPCILLSPCPLPCVSYIFLYLIPMSQLHPMHSPLSLSTPMCLLHISIPHSHVSFKPHAFSSLPAHSHVSPTYFYTSFPCLRYTPCILLSPCPLPCVSYIFLYHIPRSLSLIPILCSIRALP